MADRGFVTLIGLWLAAAATAVALTALYAARIQSTRSDDRLGEVHARHAVAVAALLYHADGFREPVLEKRIDGVDVRGARRTDRNGTTLVTTFDLSSGRFRSTCDIGWNRVGAAWRPAWWSER